ncbi:unnamed protein product [Camellia sinensis]
MGTLLHTSISPTSSLKEATKPHFCCQKKVQIQWEPTNLHPDLITFYPLTVPHVEGLPLGAETASEIPILLTTHLGTAMDLTRDQVETLLRKVKPNFVLFDTAHWMPELASKIVPARKVFEDMTLMEAEMAKPPPGYPSSTVLHSEETTLSDQSPAPPSAPTLQPLSPQPSSISTATTASIEPRLSRAGKKATLKVPPKHGPCSHLSLDKAHAPNVTQILSEDQSRVNIIHFRLSSNSAQNNILNSSKATLPVNSGASIGTGNFIVTVGLTLLFNTGRSQYGKPVFLTGPVLHEVMKMERLLEDRWARWLEGFERNSVVFCAFGSQLILEKDQFQELVLGFELTGLPFLVALKPPAGAATVEEALPKGFKERVGGRGVVYGGWVQQPQILGHPSVGCFVNHCGFGSMWESLLSNAQIVLVPHLCDQILNTRLMAEELKVAVEVARDENGWFLKESLCESICSVMDKDNEMGKLVKKNHLKWKETLTSQGFMTDNIDRFETPRILYSEISLKFPRVLYCVVEIYWQVTSEKIDVIYQ